MIFPNPEDMQCDCLGEPFKRHSYLTLQALLGLLDHIAQEAGQLTLPTRSITELSLPCLNPI